MKLTTRKTIEIYPCVKQLLTYDMPYGFSKNERALSPLVVEAEKSRMELIEKFATKDADGKVIWANKRAEFTPENLELFKEEWNRILEEEHEVAIYKILEDKFETLTYPQILTMPLEGIIIVESLED